MSLEDNPKVHFGPLCDLTLSSKNTDLFLCQGNKSSQLPYDNISNEGIGGKMVIVKKEGGDGAVLIADFDKKADHSFMRTIAGVIIPSIEEVDDPNKNDILGAGRIGVFQKETEKKILVVLSERSKGFDKGYAGCREEIRTLLEDAFSETEEKVFVSDLEDWAENNSDASKKIQSLLKDVDENGKEEITEQLWENSMPLSEWNPKNKTE